MVTGDAKADARASVENWLAAEIEWTRNATTYHQDYGLDYHNERLRLLSEAFVAVREVD